MAPHRHVKGLSVQMSYRNVLNLQNMGKKKKINNEIYRIVAINSITDEFITPICLRFKMLKSCPQKILDALKPCDPLSVLNKSGPIGFLECQISTNGDLRKIVVFLRRKKIYRTTSIFTNSENLETRKEPQKFKKKRT